MSSRGGRLLLALAAVAVAFAAADTYVVVLALPDMMASAGLSAEELQRAAPIVSGFLLGYVAVLPLIGRIADLRGRLPVLVGSLVVFAVGSLVTAAAYDLPSMVTGRVLQGLGGGGLVPATLALVADLYPVERRGMPLGLVGAVQEVGSVLGPLYGAVVLAFSSWHAIFWLNLAVAALLVVAVRRVGAAVVPEARGAGPPPKAFRVDPVGVALAAGVVAAGLLVMLQPPPLTADVTLGLAFVPVLGDGRWASPLAIAALVLLVLLVARCLRAEHPLVDLRAWARLSREVDVVGAALLTVALGGVVVAFATAEPERQLLAPGAPWLLALSALATAGFVLRNRRSAQPLVPRDAVRRTPAWGSLVVSFFVGSALIAALVDIPIFARITTYNDSQLMAALVLVRFLVALPVGAVIGGWLTQRVSVAAVTAGAMLLSAGGFVAMSRWDMASLDSAWSTVPLVATGLGFGVALAPVNAALLASTADSVHGVASALLVVARMVGMLVGISVLTTLGLARYYAEQSDLPSPFEVCGEGVSRCAEFSLILQEAGLAQLRTVFAGAAVSSLVAAVLALLLLRGARTRGTEVHVLQGHLG